MRVWICNQQQKKKEEKAAAKAAKKEAKAKKKAERTAKKNELKQLKEAAKTGDADAKAKYEATKEEHKKAKKTAKAERKAAKAEKKAKKAEKKAKKAAAKASGAAAAASSAGSKKQIFVGADYKLDNKMDDDVVEAVKWDLDWTSKFTKENFLEKLVEFRQFQGPPAHAELPKSEYTDLCDIEEVPKLGGPDFHKDAIANNCFIHRKKGSTGLKPAVVYWHGGGTVAGDAINYRIIMNRIASDSDVTVFNCNYGLCPERIAPLGIRDAYSQLMEILKNHAKYKIDPSRVCIMGESGGGYICIGVALTLAENNQSDLVKLSYTMIPQCDASYFEKDPDSTWTDAEKAYMGFFRGINQCHLKDNKCARHWIFPNAAPDSLVKKCPPTLLLSTEFDFFRKACENMSTIYKRNGRLLEFGIMKGVHHGHFFDFSCKRAGAWFKAIQDGLQVHLK